MPAKSAVSDAAERAMRSTLLTLSHRRSLGRLATRVPVTRPMVRRFICGETLDEALPAIRRLHEQGMGTTVDVLGESVTAEADARAAAARYLTVAGRAGVHRARPECVAQAHPDGPGDRPGPAPARPSARSSPGRSRWGPSSGSTWRTTRPPTAPWRCGATSAPPTPAGPTSVSSSRPRCVAATRTSRPSSRCVAGCACARAPTRSRRRSPTRTRPTLMRRSNGRCCASSGLAATLRSPPTTSDSSGVRSDVARAEQIGRDRFEFQMLYGVRRDIQEQLVGAGWRVRTYVPFGSQWYPYFMRRLAERPANVSFILRNLWRERGRG